MRSNNLSSFAENEVVVASLQFDCLISDAKFDSFGVNLSPVKISVQLGYS